MVDPGGSPDKRHKRGAFPIHDDRIQSFFNPFNVLTILTIAEITIQVKHPNLLTARYRIIRVYYTHLGP